MGGGRSPGGHSPGGRPLSHTFKGGGGGRAGGGGGGAGGGGGVGGCGGFLCGGGGARGAGGPSATRSSHPSPLSLSPSLSLLTTPSMSSILVFDEPTDVSFSGLGVGGGASEAAPRPRAPSRGRRRARARRSPSPMHSRQASHPFWRSTSRPHSMDSRLARPVMARLFRSLLTPSIIFLVRTDGGPRSPAPAARAAGPASGISVHHPRCEDTTLCVWPRVVPPHFFAALPDRFFCGIFPQFCGLPTAAARRAALRSGPCHRGRRRPPFPTAIPVASHQNAHPRPGNCRAVVKLPIFFSARTALACIHA